MPIATAIFFPLQALQLAAGWGVETTIVVPGAFITGGTKHFAHSGRPADTAVVAEYEAGPYKGFADDVIKGFASISASS